MSIHEQFRLEGRVALVTGSTKGIGRAIAEGFAAAGAKVYLHGRDAVAGRALAEKLGGGFIDADLARAGGVATIVQTLTARESRLDVLVNNAGMEHVMPLGTPAFDIATFDKMWQVNVRSAIELLHELVPLLKASGHASVINITSIHDTMPYPQNTPYSMTKAALAMLSKGAAVELAPLGIRVNNLAPGAVETDINRAVIEQIGRDKFAEWIPAGRVAKVEEMVGPALFLASEASSYVTGTTLYADGGYLQHLVRYRPALDQ